MEERGTLNFTFGNPAVKEIGESKVKLNMQYNIERLLSKDSLEMTQEDRELIKRACEGAVTNKILITHGTDTMIETAMVLSDIKNKVIILTGASQPCGFWKNSMLLNKSPNRAFVFVD